MTLFRDRTDAGQQLAEALRDYADQKDTLILALPRGGLPVGFEIAKVLHLPMDAFLVRKLGVPGQEELAMGAIAMGGVHFFNQNILGMLDISKEDIQRVIAAEEQEMQRRNQVYRGGKPPPAIENRTVILVDDGVATGATILAAVSALKKMKPKSLIIAVPVAPSDTLQKLEAEVDQVVCLAAPENFFAISAWYQEFPQTSDEQVCDFLERAKRK